MSQSPSPQSPSPQSPSPPSQPPSPQPPSPPAETIAFPWAPALITFDGKTHRGSLTKDPTQFTQIFCRATIVDDEPYLDISVRSNDDLRLPNPRPGRLVKTFKIRTALKAVNHPRCTYGAIWDDEEDDFHADLETWQGMGIDFQDFKVATNRDKGHASIGRKMNFFQVEVTGTRDLFASSVLESADARLLNTHAVDTIERIRAAHPSDNDMGCIALYDAGTKLPHLPDFYSLTYELLEQGQALDRALREKAEKNLRSVTIRARKHMVNCGLAPEATEEKGSREVKDELGQARETLLKALADIDKFQNAIEAAEKKVEQAPSI